MKLSLLPVLSSHIKLLHDYIEERPRARKEVVLFSETDFERERIFRSVCLLFYSLINPDISRVKISVSGHLSHSVENFYAYLDETYPLETMPSLILDNCGEIIPWDGVTKLPPPLTREGTDREIFRWAMEFFVFGDNIQACQYFDLLYGRNRVGSLSFDAEDRAGLFRYYGLAALDLNQEDLALTIFNSLLNMAVYLRESRLMALAYCLTGEVYRKKERLKQAVHFYRKSLELDGVDGEIRFEALFSLFLCSRRIKDCIEAEEKDELLELAEKLGRTKGKGIVLLYSDPTRLDEVIELFTRRENPILRSQALLARGIYEWQTQKDRKKGEESLLEALETRKGHKGPYLPMVILHMLGQLYEEDSRPEMAFRCYAGALEGYLREERFEEMARLYLTLSEMGFRLSCDAQARSLLRTARYIVNRLPEASESLREEISRYVPPPPSVKKEPAAGPDTESPRNWFVEPIDREWVSTNLKQHVRYEQLKKGMYEINLLSDIQSILAGTEDRDRLIFLTMERLLSSSLVSSISYYERLEDSYRLAYHSSLLDIEPDRQDLDDFLTFWERGIRNLSTSPSGMLLIPVISEDLIKGVIICRPESPHYVISDEEKQIFSILAGQFSSALEKIRQKELILSKNRRLEAINRELTITTLTDPLTGIGNRIQLNEKIKEFSSRYGGSRERDNFTLLFIDLDNFKYYNDTYGHPVGDRLLEDFSRVLQNACRDSDCIFRYGGDEFVLLLAETDGQSSTLIAERILHELEDKKGYADFLGELGYGEKIPREKWLSCSIGISDFLKAERDGKKLLKQADEALYDAKESGRKQWKIHRKDKSNE